MKPEIRKFISQKVIRVNPEQKTQTYEAIAEFDDGRIRKTILDVGYQEGYIHWGLKNWVLVEPITQEKSDIIPNRYCQYGGQFHAHHFSFRSDIPEDRKKCMFCGCTQED